MWRVNKFKLQEERDFQGQLYNGDSYILLLTRKVEKAGAAPIFAWDIYFWLGATTSQDEGMQMRANFVSDAV